MWRAAHPSEDREIIEMCLALYEEDPSPKPVPAEHTKRTLAEFIKNPIRGRAVVLELSGHIAGYALLASFWSNEVGGEICTIDEFYVRPAYRGQGHGKILLEMLANKDPVWPGATVALDLEVTPDNARAREFYSRMGFRPAKNTHMRLRFD